MKVTLALPYDGHAPDEVIDVDQQTGSNLISSGWARLPATDDLSTLTVDELRSHATDNQIDLGQARTKADILTVIGETTAPPTPPPDGTTTKEADE